MSDALLAVEDLEVRYGGARALFGVSLSVAPGSVLAVLGANGAGKSSLAGAIAGVVPPAAGHIRFAGRDITKASSYRIARLGLAHVPEQRGIFPGLSVLDNVRLGLLHVLPRAEQPAAIERAFEAFPRLADRRRQLAGTLSGGEQQMLSLARVLAVPPKLLVADELSLGLAPLIVDLIFESLERTRGEGVSVLLIEQYVDRALAFADEAVILRRGRVGWHGAASDATEELLEEYLGGDRPADFVRD